MHLQSKPSEFIVTQLNIPIIQSFDNLEIETSPNYTKLRFSCMHIAYLPHKDKLNKHRTRRTLSAGRKQHKTSQYCIPINILQ